jgi:hypothetical protein
LANIFEAIRHLLKEQADENKTLWISEVREEEVQDDRLIPSVGALTWFGDKGPWAVFTV